MAKLPSYAGLSIGKASLSTELAGPVIVDTEPAPAQSVPIARPTTAPKPTSAARTRSTRRTPSIEPEARLRDRGRSTVVTMAPAFVRELKLYCLEADRSMHSVILEAIEDWAKKNGLKGPVQA